MVMVLTGILVTSPCNLLFSHSNSSGDSLPWWHRGAAQLAVAHQRHPSLHLRHIFHRVGTRPTLFFCLPRKTTIYRQVLCTISCVVPLWFGSRTQAWDFSAHTHTLFIFVSQVITLPEVLSFKLELVSLFRGYPGVSRSPKSSAWFLLRGFLRG